jgi:hypothetical protein
MNRYIKTHSNTFYFAMSSGERKVLKGKDRELFKEPCKLTKNHVGFDTCIRKTILYRNSSKKQQRRD